MKNDNARDTFPKVGDYAQVQDVSGAPWPGAEMVLRDGTITPPRPGQALSPRTQTIITAESGQDLGEMTERATAYAARRLSIRETVDQSHPSARPMLEHIFGLNLPGRDRA